MMFMFAKLFKIPRKWQIFILIFVACVSTASYYFYESYYYPSTDDAYANANIVYVSSQVQGQVAMVNVIDHQNVKAGDVLFTLVTQPFTDAYQQAQAQLKVVQQQLLADQDSIKVAQAALSQSQANLLLNQKESQRILKLVKQGYASADQGDQAVANLQSSRAQVQSNVASLAQSRQNLLVQQAQVQVAKANVATAQTNLGYTTVRASVSGIIGNINLRPGAVVSPGVNLFAVVDTSGYWIDANFKETQLQRLHVGQSADVVFDMYPGVAFHGTVQSLSVGSGDVFSLLPAENASGNWVKVTQRFVVRIQIPRSQLQAQYPIRVGATASVTVDTK